MYKGLLTRTKVVRLSEHAQKNVFFSLYDVGFLFVPSSETIELIVSRFGKRKSHY